MEDIELVANYEKRKHCWEMVKDTMMLSITGERSKGKGSGNRKHFLTGIRCMIRQFATFDDEYKHIQKFGRGIWTKSIIESFNKIEQKLIIEVIAHEMGAFDY